MRLVTTKKGINQSVPVPSYDRDRLRVGIVHIGMGAFFRAHMAAYTDAALSAAEIPDNWLVTGISLRHETMAEILNPQKGLYTLLEKDGKHVAPRIIGSIANVIYAGEWGEAGIATMVDVRVRIVSLSVTERAYGIDLYTQQLLEFHPEIAHDLQNPDQPISVLGYLLLGLKRRAEAKMAPFTVLCCDNLHANGQFVKAGLMEYARRVAPEYVDYINEHVAFPCTVMDRIVPAPNQKTSMLASNLIGAEDEAAVETETFTSCIMEDNFPHGRPHWEQAGVVFTDSIGKYADLKLRLVDSTQALVAYTGFLCGHHYVHEAIADKFILTLVKRHLHACIATIDDDPEFNMIEFGKRIIRRLSNTGLNFETYRLTHDGTSKLPHQLLRTIGIAIDKGLDTITFAFAVAMWMRYCLGRRDDENHSRFVILDLLENYISAAVERSEDATALVQELLALPGLFPQQLIDNERFVTAVEQYLILLVDEGVANIVRQEAISVNPELA